jgi:hypothetical protein
MGLTCPSCGNEENFQVKTLQMHLVQVDGENVGLAQEGRPAVLEVLCDECESEVDLRDVDDEVRGEVLHLLGAGQS